MTEVLHPTAHPTGLFGGGAVARPPRLLAPRRDAPAPRLRPTERESWFLDTVGTMRVGLTQAVTEASETRTYEVKDMKHEFVHGMLGEDRARRAIRGRLDEESFAEPGRLLAPDSAAPAAGRELQGAPIEEQLYGPAPAVQLA